MSIIIRLQNLPWSANSLDIRRFFTGSSIPEGGVHIVGGEMGDAFIAFSTDEDARLAMEKDGGKIKDMQIKLLLSSRTEMMRVIEQARQQNMVVTQPHMAVPQAPILSLQQPARIMTPTSEPERRRVRSPTPPRRSRDRSPVRDRRRSPDDRRTSKRDRSRSPSRSSRSFSRDTDRRNDRFRRDDRRYDDSRYRDDRRSERDTTQHTKRYPDADHVNSKSQLLATEGFRNMTPYEQASTVAPGLYPYGNQQPAVKGFQEPYAHTSANLPSHLPHTEQMTAHKPQDFPPMGDQKYPLSSAYPLDSSSYRGPTFESSNKDSSVSSVEQNGAKARRNTRFEPEFAPPSVPSHFGANDTKPPLLSQHEMPYNDIRTMQGNFSGNYPERSTWPHEAVDRSNNKIWNEKQENLMNPSVSKNRDFLQVVPMDIDQSPSDISAEKDTYHEALPHRGPQAPVINDILRRDNQNRGLPVPVDKAHLNQNKGPSSHDEKRKTNIKDREIGLHSEKGGMPLQERGSLPHSDNRTLPQQERGTTSQGENRIHTMQDRSPIEPRGPHGENRTQSMQDRRHISHTENRMHSIQDRGPMSRENREHPIQDRGPVTHANREHPMQERVPMSRENREHSMPERGPMSRENREHPMHERGPMSRENREHPMEGRGLMPRPDNIEHSLQERGPMSLAKNRERPMQDRESITHAENRAQDRGPRSYSENRGSPARDRGPASHSDGRGQPMHNDSSGRMPHSLTVEIRGLPPDARIDDILDLFHGIPLPAANIRIEANNLGLEKAFIRFVSVADFEEALRRNRQFIHEGRCELVPCPAVAFDSAPRSQKPRPKLKPCDGDLTVQLRGLPFSCKEEDVVNFFDGLGILDLFIEIAPDGRASGTGFVEFGTNEDFRTALTMNGKMIGHRYITVSIASKEMMAFARGEDFNPEFSGPHPVPPFSNSGHSANQGRPLPNHVRPPGPPINQGRQETPPIQPRPPPCISMKGLPEDVTNRDIVDFLGQMNVLPRAVHIMLRPDKTPSGDAFAEFGCPADMEVALQLNDRPMRGNCVSIQSISFHEMSEILGRPTMPPPPAPTALLKTPVDVERSHRPDAERPHRSIPGDTDRPDRPRRPPPMDVERSRRPLPADIDRPRRPALVDMDRPRRPLLPQGPNEGVFRERPRMEPPGRSFGPGRMRGPWPSRPYSGGNRPESRYPPPPAERGLKDFGAPGCVVSIKNLHFKAGLEELLDFFCDYRITKDSIRRKYNENGQTTGEARIAFQSPRDAQRAVRELNQKPIMGRSLSLSVL